MKVLHAIVASKRVPCERKGHLVDGIYLCDIHSNARKMAALGLIPNIQLRKIQPRTFNHWRM